MDDDRATHQIRDADSRVPIDVIESTVWSVFEQTLATTVRPWDNLFKIGGTSIDALRIHGRVAEQTGTKVALERFLLRPTIQDLARLIRQAQQANSEPMLAQYEDLTARVPLLIPFSRVGVMLSLLPPATQAMVGTLDPPDVREDSLAVTAPQLLSQYPLSVRRWLFESPTLAAYSVSADLALEIVAHRERQGRPVQRLILLDPAFQPHVRRAEMWRLLELTPEDLGDNPGLLTVLNDIDRFRQTPADQRNSELLPELLSALKPFVALFARLDNNFELHESERTLLYRDYVSFFRLMIGATQHEPPMIDSPITFVLSSSFEQLGGWQIMDECMDAFRGPVDVLHIEGDHFNVLLAPELAQLFATELGQSAIVEDDYDDAPQPSWLRV